MSNIQNQTIFTVCVNLFCSYSVDKLTEMMVFSVTLDVELCIDNACVTTSILDHVWVPIPICNINAVTFTLPGDGTVAGFIKDLGGRIGDSAIDLVLEKYGLNVRILLLSFISVKVSFPRQLLLQNHDQTLGKQQTRKTPL